MPCYPRSSGSCTAAGFRLSIRCGTEGWESSSCSLGLCRAILLRLFIRNTEIVRNLQLPYPSAWDYYFDEREPAFVLIHLENGNLIGGYFGSNSYATSFPNQGDLYLEAVYEVAEDGTFDEPIEDTDGMIITSDEYHYVELFTLPASQTEEDQNE